MPLNTLILSRSCVATHPKDKGATLGAVSGDLNNLKISRALQVYTFTCSPSPPKFEGLYEPTKVSLAGLAWPPIQKDRGATPKAVSSDQNNLSTKLKGSPNHKIRRAAHALTQHFEALRP